MPAAPVMKRAPPRFRDLGKGIVQPSQLSNFGRSSPEGLLPR